MPDKVITLTERVTALGAWLRTHGPSWRAFLIALLLLALADGMARLAAQWDMERDDFYLPWRSDALVRPYLEHIGEYRGPLIAMIGDSTLQPLPEMPHDQTVPNLMQKKIRTATGNGAWRVANIGLSGAHPADYANLAHLLPRNVDVIIMTLNYKFLGPTAEQPLMIYPRLADHRPRPQLKQPLKMISRPVWAVQDSWDKLGEYWFLARNGQWVADRVFGNRPGNWLHYSVASGWLRLQTRALYFQIRGLPIPPRQEYAPWNADYIAKMKTAIAFGDLRLNNPQIKRLGGALLELRRRGFVTIVYATPLNWSKISEFGIADRTTVHDNLEVLGSLVEQTGAVFLNLVDVGEPAWFMDMDHLSPGGRDRLADLLIAEIRRRLGHTEGEQL